MSDHRIRLTVDISSAFSDEMNRLAAQYGVDRSAVLRMGVEALAAHGPVRHREATKASDMPDDLVASLDEVIDSTMARIKPEGSA